MSLRRLFCLRDLLHDWENFVNQDPLLPPLIQCAIMHYQFEAIHPYVDGNGRLGRLLIVLFLCSKGVLPQPLLYLSAYFERDRAAYYDHLFRTSATGDWQAWIGYFLDGVVEQAHDALHRARRMRDLRGENEGRAPRTPGVRECPDAVGQALREAVDNCAGGSAISEHIYPRRQGNT